VNPGRSLQGTCARSLLACWLPCCAAAPAEIKAAPHETHAAPPELSIGSARLRVVFPSGAFELGDTALLDWIQRSARAVEAYYARFPVSDLAVELSAFDGRGLNGGRVLPRRAPTIAMRVGTRSSAVHLERNWSMTHEMVHLALPNLPAPHHWLEEGLATYVEPIARVRVGWLREEDVWKEWIESLPRGLPEPGDRGLDHTPTWARTYWGGALFCFVADLEIRKATGNQRQLSHALRGVLAAGGNITQRWPIERVLRTGDAATGTRVLSELYRAMSDAPKTFDLEGLWRELGVALVGGRIRYRDQAPLGALRRSWFMEQ
jgi:hypothetical protein